VQLRLLPPNSKGDVREQFPSRGLKFYCGHGLFPAGCQLEHA
jgi:hypothetical protein